MNPTTIHGPLMPILAAGLGGVISLLFVVIAFISWLWGVINGDRKVPGKAAPRPQPVPGARRQEKELQAEINRFLRNVMGQQQQSDEVDSLEVVDEPAAPRRLRPKRADSMPAPLDDSDLVVEESESRFTARHPGGRIAKRKGPGSENLGANVRQHLAEHMQDRVARQAQEHLAHGVAEKVQQDLGVFTAPIAAAPAITREKARPAMTAANLGNMMRDPAGMRQAFVLNLIINRPTRGRRL